MSELPYTRMHMDGEGNPPPPYAGSCPTPQAHPQHPQQAGDLPVAPPYVGGYPTTAPQGYPQNGYLPPQASNQQPNGYSPPQAPMIVNQQPSVVTVVQPASTPPANVEVVQQIRPARDYLILTIVVMVVFGILGGLFGAVIVIPALICSLMALSNNDLGNHRDAKKYGQTALWCNISVIIYHVILWMIIIVVIIVFATGVQLAADTQLQASSAFPPTMMPSSDPATQSRCTRVLTKVCNYVGGYTCYYQYVYRCT